jgi:hypothetical protein
MKSIYVLLILLTTTKLMSQTTDILFIPKQNSLLATYTSRSFVGMYVGGFYVTSFPQPYTYTTPLSILNRVGVVLGNNKISIMGGIYGDYLTLYSNVKPDLWIKINPIRTLIKSDAILDLSFAINYSQNINYGIGVSISID